MAARFDFYYLVQIQYLGFRYHGWQTQPGQKTLQGMLEKTFRYLFKEQKFRVLGAGRTDAMVSAESAYFELFTNIEVDENLFREQLDSNLPSDIKVLSFKTIKEEFNIIQDVSLKTYHYYFASVKEKYPFASPFMNCLTQPLDVEKMMAAAQLYEGEHDFQHYTNAASSGKKTVRVIHECKIIKNNELTASFFPDTSYLLVVKGKGFMRYQIRLMMGALIRVGSDLASFDDIRNSLKGETPKFEKLTAAASGLRVRNIEFMS